MVLSLCLVNPGFTQDGTLDPSFGQEGIVLPDLPEYTRSYPKVVLSRADGKIIVAGNAVFGKDVPGTPYDIYLLQYLEDGTPDLSFGENGIVQEAYSAGTDLVQAGILQTDGKIVITGSFTKSVSENGEVNSNVFLARFLSDGTPDETFGTAGKVTLQIGSGQDVPQRLIEQSDGKLVVGGFYFNGRNQESFFLRFLADGTPDPDFGENGRSILRFEGVSNAVRAMSLQTDGKIMGAGERSDGQVVVRFLPNGERDVQFADQGILPLDVSLPNASIYDFIRQADGQILAVVNYFESEGTNLNWGAALLRITSNGEYDGDYFRQLAQSDTSLFVEKLKLQADGKILLTGRLQTAESADEEAFLMRLLSDGRLDPTFGEKGLVTYRPGAYNNRGLTLALQADGKILVVGSLHEDAIYNYSPFLARFENTKPLRAPVSLLQVGEVQVFPNPASEDFVVQYELLQEEYLSIRLYDLEGRLIASILENKRSVKGAYKQPIAFPDGAAAGTYILQFSTGQAQVGLKVIKDK